MLSEKLGHRLDTPLSTILKHTFISRANPTTLTLTGFIFNILAATAIYTVHWKTGGILILVAGVFDILDGVIARSTNRVSEFGGFIDSVIDRYSDMIILMSFLLYYAENNCMLPVALCAAASIGITLTPYTRARAEKFLTTCNTGILERAERIIIIALGCYFNMMIPVLWILAIFTNITVLQRIQYTWKKSRETEKTSNHP